jgi:preprotein translocase subunit SecE
MTNIITYIEESYEELVHKVTWPTWSELQSTSVVVLVASVLFALAIFAMDYVFGINIKYNAEGTQESGMWDGILGLYYRFVGAFK